jgi:pilus assembly protein Flp/PilA
MTKFISAIKKFASDEQGVTAIEYGLIASVLAGAVLTAFGALGTGLTGFFDTLVAKLTLAD